MELINYCLAKFEVLRTMQNLRRDERGVTALEYGLIAAFIAVAIIGAITALGGSLTALFGRISAAVALAAPAP